MSATTTTSTTDLRRGPKRERGKPSNNGNGAIIDRLPPHSQEAEQGVLGCAMLSPQDVLPLCLEKFPVGSEVFYDLRHQTIYQTLLELYDDGEGIDVITLQQRLKDWGTLEQVGGIAYIANLPGMVPGATNASYYIDIVRDKYLLRKTIQVNVESAGRIYDFEGDADELLDSFERDVLALGQSRVLTQSRDTVTLVRTAIQQIEDMHNRQGALAGLSTGFIDLDRMTDGLITGLYVLAARPSVGKTSLAMNIAEHVSVELRLPVGVFSIEMTAEALIQRMIFARARVNARNAREGFLAERDFPKLTGAAGCISRAPLYIDDTSSIPLMQLRAKARRWKQQHQIRLLIVDYLQLVDPGPGSKNENREQQVARVSKGIKALSKEISIPIILLCQLNRSIEREKREPRLSDLRESGAIEQDADFVGMLYKPARQEGDEEREREDTVSIPINLMIAKQRNGPVGDVHLTFLKIYTKFESAARVCSSDDEPVQRAQAAQQQFPDP